MAIEHEPLRPVARGAVLVRVHDPEDLAQGPRLPGGDEQLRRALAHVPQPPRGAAGLLQPMGRRGVDQRVVEIPAHEIVQTGHVVHPAARAAAESRVTPEPGPERRRRTPVGWPALEVHAGVRVQSGTPCRRPCVQEVARVRDLEVLERRRPDHDVRSAALDAVGMEQAVATDRADPIGICGDDESGFRVAPAHQARRVRAKLDPALWRVDHDRADGIEFVLAEDDVVGHDQLDRPARVHVDGQPADGLVDRDVQPDRQAELAVPVQPRRIARAHLEGRRHAEELVAASGLDKDPEAARLEHVQRAATDAQELVERRVADRQLRRERAEHPGRDRQGGVARQQVVARAQDMTRRALLDELLGLEHHVPLVAMEERTEAPVGALDMAPVGPERGLELGDPEIPALEQHRSVEEAGRARQPRLVDHEAPQATERHAGSARPTQIPAARRGRMIGLEGTEERHVCRRPGRQRHRPGLERRQCKLVLGDPVRKRGTGEGRRDARGLGGQSVELQPVGQVADGTLETAMHDPRERAVLGQALARADQRPELGVIDDRVIDVLARVQLARPDGPRLGDPEVLGEDEIETCPAGGGVGHRHGPEPRRIGLGETERAPVVQSVERPLPGRACVGGSEVTVSRRPEQGLIRDADSPASSKEEVRQAAFQWVGKDLVDEDVAVADGKDRAILEDVDRESAGVAEPGHNRWRRRDEGRARVGQAQSATSTVSDDTGIDRWSPSSTRPPSGLTARSVTRVGADSATGRAGRSRGVWAPAVATRAILAGEPEVTVGGRRWRRCAGRLRTSPWR